MRPGDRLRALWLRWDRVVLALALSLPFLVSALLGFLWLWERGWLLVFLLSSLSFVAVVRLARWLALRRPAALEPDPDPELGDAPGTGTGSGTGKGRGRGTAAAIPPDWSEAERAVYARARKRIRSELPAPLPWDALPLRAVAVVEAVASDLSSGRRGALDFTAPEALLLIGRLSRRYRRLLLDRVPFADRLSLQALWWVWQRQDSARAAAQGSWLVWRGVRMVVNPIGAMLREAEQLLASNLQDRLGETVTSDLQARLLDEAAMAAIDLYSGRLRFTDAELAGLTLPDQQRDSATAPATPLRVLLVGQLSAGKSTLLNALAGQDLAETDAAPVTERTQAVEMRLDDTDLRLVDTPGLDGSDRRCQQVAKEAAEADLLLWVLRADRPDRGPDHALRAALDAHLARFPDRRAPPVVSVASAADLLLPGWPWPEHHLPAQARQRLAAAMSALAADWPGTVLPVSAAPPPWNLDALHGALADALAQAQQVQRQRQRLAGRKLNPRQTIAQAGRGLRDVAGAVTGAVSGAVAGAVARRLGRKRD